MARKHFQKRGRPTQKEATGGKKPYYVFFYRPLPEFNGIYCQWTLDTFQVPVHTLSWLWTACPKYASYEIPAPSASEVQNFNCTEQFMMFCKAAYFHDEAMEGMIMSSRDPKEQKAFGKMVKGWDEVLWEQVRDRAVWQGNWFKFTCNAEFKKTLLATDTKTLVEAAGNDRIWGIGYNARQALTVDRSKWGLNLLGKAIMKVRAGIRERLTEIEKGERQAGDWSLPLFDGEEAVEEQQTVQQVLKEESLEEGFRQLGSGESLKHKNMAAAPAPAPMPRVSMPSPKKQVCLVCGDFEATRRPYFVILRSISTKEEVKRIKLCNIVTVQCLLQLATFKFSFM